MPCLGADLSGELNAAGAAQNLPADAAEALNGLSPTAADAGFDGGLERLWNYVNLHIHEAAAEVFRPTAAVIAISVLCAAGDPLALREAGKFDYVNFGGCLAVAAASITDVRSVIAMGSETVEALWEYSHTLLPTLTTAAVSAGAVTSAGAKYAAAALFSDLLLTAAEGFVLPLICGYLAAETAGAALGTGQLNGAARLLHWAAKTSMKALVAAFAGYLALTGVLSGAADAAAVKAAKAALSTALPVVGGTLAGASEALVAGAAMVRNAIGAFGLLAVLAAVTLPVLRLGLRYLLFKAASAVAQVLAGGRIGGLIDAVGTAYGMVLGLVGTAAAIAFLSIISFMRTVTA